MNGILSDFVRTLGDHGNTILSGQVALLESLGEQFKGHSVR